MPALAVDMNSPERTNIFFLADQNYDKYVIPEKKKERPPRTVPMPTIDSPNIRGPIQGPDEEYERAWNLKKKKEKEDEYKLHQDRMIDLLNLRDKFVNKLNKLNPTKSNQREIAFINFNIEELNNKIKDLEEVSGIRLDALDQGSKVAKFWNRLKKTVKKTVKKVTRFLKKHKETIIPCLVIAIPTLIRWGIRLIFGL